MSTATGLPLDFRRSFMRWDKPRNPNDPRPHARHNTPLGNRVRIELDSVLTVLRPQGTPERYFLIAPCRSEWVYAEREIFQIPSREFRCAYSQDHERGMGRSLLWDGTTERASAANGWELEIDLQTFSRSSVHDTIAAVTAASEGKDPLVGRTTMSHPDGCYECTLEYPIKTMNFRPETPSFQVDTGPLVLPDFSSSEESMIDRLVMAHVAFNRFDRAEFIIRLPTPIDESRPDGPRTLHYAEVREYPATNQILTGAY